MAAYLKAPSALLDYSIDWAPAYLGTRTIATSTWTIAPIEPGGLAVNGEAQQDGRTTVVLAGGVPGHVYQVCNQVALSDGAIDARSITVRVDAR